MTDGDVVRVRLTGVTAVDRKPRHVEPGDSRVTHLKLYTPKEQFAGDAGARCAATAETSIAGGTGVHKDAEGEGCITLDGDRVHLDLRVED